MLSQIRAGTSTSNCWPHPVPGVAELQPQHRASSGTLHPHVRPRNCPCHTGPWAQTSQKDLSPGTGPDPASEPVPAAFSFLVYVCFHSKKRKSQLTHSPSGSHAATPPCLSFPLSPAWEPHITQATFSLPTHPALGKPKNKTKQKATGPDLRALLCFTTKTKEREKTTSGKLTARICVKEQQGGPGKPPPRVEQRRPRRLTIDKGLNSALGSGPGLCKAIGVGERRAVYLAPNSAPTLQRHPCLK